MTFGKNGKVNFLKPKPNTNSSKPQRTTLTQPNLLASPPQSDLLKPGPKTSRTNANPTELQHSELGRNRQ
jgi:hypothetical protein